MPTTCDFAVRLSTVGDSNFWGKSNLHLNSSPLQSVLFYKFFLHLFMMSDSFVKASVPIVPKSIDSKLDTLMNMFLAFQKESYLEGSKNSYDMDQIKTVLAALRNPSSPTDHDTTLFPECQKDNRRTSMFLGLPLSNNSQQTAKSQITFI